MRSVACVHASDREPRAADRRQRDRRSEPSIADDQLVRLVRAAATGRDRRGRRLAARSRGQRRTAQRLAASAASNCRAGSARRVQPSGRRAAGRWVAGVDGHRKAYLALMRRARHKTAHQRESFVTIDRAARHSAAMNGHFFPRDEYYMRLALREAERALDHDDVPVGAVDRQGRRGDRRRAQRARAAQRPDRPRRDARAARGQPHARQLARARRGHVRDARALRDVRRRDRARRASRESSTAPRDPKAGAAGSVLDLLDVPELNHRPQVAGRACLRGVRRRCCGRSSRAGAEHRV